MQPSDTTKKNPDQNEKGEIPGHAGVARKLERELDLGVKKEDGPVTPGMPEAQGGGLHSEIGTTPKENDPDR